VPDSGLDLGAIFRQHASQVGELLSAEQRQALRDLGACRTAALGGRIEQCSACGQREYVYHSCRNRHCPKCQAGCRAAWLEREAGYLLPVEYHHLVFTLPHELVALAVGNPRLIYGLLFEAASAAVRELAANPKYLGAQVGLTAVLHTWGQNLSLHPHLHLMASGGGLSCNRHGEIEEEPCWRRCRPGFFLPVRPLSRLFRGKFLAGLREAQAAGTLRLGPEWSGPGAFEAQLSVLVGKEWVVYSKPPSAGAEVVLKYLARYTYRVAFSNSRLVSVTDEEVTFTWKDYRQEGVPKEMTLSCPEFVRRFLQHVLPRGLVRSRHYGLLANRGREEKLAVCRALLAKEGLAPSVAAGPLAPPAGVERGRCRECGRGVMEIVEILPRLGQEQRAGASWEDSS
jgi:hypothetical protein